VAASDARPSVVDAALDAVQAVTAALFRGVGVDADAFGPVCDVVETAMRNPLHEGLSARATGIVPAIAQRLRASTEKVGCHSSGSVQSRVCGGGGSFSSTSGQALRR